MMFIYQLTKWLPRNVQIQWHKRDPSTDKYGKFYEGESEELYLTCSIWWYCLCMYERLFTLLLLTFIYLITFGALPLVEE